MKQFEEKFDKVKITGSLQNILELLKIAPNKGYTNKINRLSEEYISYDKQITKYINKEDKDLLSFLYSSGNIQNEHLLKKLRQVLKELKTGQENLNKSAKNKKYLKAMKFVIPSLEKEREQLLYNINIDKRIAYAIKKNNVLELKQILQDNRLDKYRQEKVKKALKNQNIKSTIKTKTRIDKVPFILILVAFILVVSIFLLKR